MDGWLDGVGKHITGRKDGGVKVRSTATEANKERPAAGRDCSRPGGAASGRDSSGRDWTKQRDWYLARDNSASGVI